MFAARYAMPPCPNCWEPSMPRKERRRRIRAVSSCKCRSSRRTRAPSPLRCTSPATTISQIVPISMFRIPPELEALVRWQRWWRRATCPASSSAAVCRSAPEFLQILYHLDISSLHCSGCSNTRKNIFGMHMGGYSERKIFPETISKPSKIDKIPPKQAKS